MGEPKRLTITLLPEWEQKLDHLKQDQFYDKSKADMLRHLIELGLQVTAKK